MLFGDRLLRRYFKYGRPIAEGSFGTVYLAKCGGYSVAIKMMRLVTVIGEMRECLIKNEIEILKTLQYVDVVTVMLM